MSRHISLKFTLLIVSLLLAWGALPVQAATLTVNSTADSGAGSLREALTNAANGDTIQFTITGTIQLLSNLPKITQTGLTINGSGATVRGGTDIRIFTVESGASVTVNNLTLTDGNCTAACLGSLISGGAIANLGTVTINNSRFSNNTASDLGGVIFNSGAVTINGSTFSNNSAAIGGVIGSAGTVTISNSTFSNNSADTGGVIGNGGTMAISQSSFSNNSTSNAGIIGGGVIINEGTVTISQSSFSNNSTLANGGAINNAGTLTLTNSTLSGNSANTGGGIRSNSGTVTISGSTLSSNSAAQGAGIDAQAGTVTISGSTLSSNSAFVGGSMYIANNVQVTITNSTLFANSASSGGGGILNTGSTVTLSNSTVSSNSAYQGAGILNGGGTVTISNSLFSKGGSGDNCYGTITSNGAAYNLSDDGSCGAGVTQVASLGLGTLGANGGPTQTVPLLVGSPAVDAANAADCPATDQRDVARPVGAGCDIGAFEGVITLSSPDLVPPAPALCSLTGFSSSEQVAIYLPNGGGLNVCYTLLTDPVQAGVTDQPFTLAAEVYTFDSSGSVTTSLPVQVCLQGAGSLLYRDASGQPRTTVPLPSFAQGGFTCGLIPRAGTVILVPGAASPAAAAAQIALSACRVTTTNILNLRAAPDATSAVLDLVPYQTALNADARAGDWLRVVYGSQQGWLAAAYLTLDGGCG